MDIELEPEEAGFAPDRLDRLDRHFARYVDDGLLAGWQVAITRDGKLVHHTTYGLRDREAGLAVEPDTIWRIYSMTKPLTSVAAMMLYEQGRLALRQPIAEILPEFADARVYQLGSALNPGTVAFVPCGGLDMHGDFVTRAWRPDPLKAALAMIPGYAPVRDKKSA